MSQFQENGIRLEGQLVKLASQNPKAGWLLDEYRSTEKHANTALQYILQYGRRHGHMLPQTVKLETQPTTFMNAYATRDSNDIPLIYVNAGLRFFLIMLNYSLARATFQDTLLGGQSMNAILFTIVNGYWPPEVDLLAEIEAMGEFPEDERYFITAWIPSQMFFVVAHEFAQHLIWYNEQDPPQTQIVRLPTGKEIKTYIPSERDELRIDEIAFEIWNDLDLTLSTGFQAFTAGGLGALFGYFRILEEYTQTRPAPSDPYPPATHRYGRINAWLSDTERVHSLQAMEETWAVAEMVTKSCLEAKEMLKRQGLESTKKEAPANEGT